MSQLAIEGNIPASEFPSILFAEIDRHSDQGLLLYKSFASWIVALSCNLQEPPLFVFLVKKVCQTLPFFLEPILVQIVLDLPLCW